MLTGTKKHLLRPALRTARQHLAHLVPGVADHWHWYFCPQEGPFLHLVLLDEHLLLAHWVLPAAQAEVAATLLPGVWAQVPPATNLAVPAVHQAVARGTCRVGRQAVGLTPGAGPAGQLLLHVPAAASTECYVLTQLRPGGPGWLLRKLPGAGPLDSK